MNTELITVKPETPIYQAIELMVENNLTALPVITEDMTLIGIISEKDILDLLIDISHTPKTVDHYMTTDVTSFDVDEDIIAVCECLVDQPFRRVPILEDSKLVGIISRKDLIKYILEPIDTSNNQQPPE